MSLEGDVATHSGILAWEIPWTEELGRLQSMGDCKSVGHDFKIKQQQSDERSRTKHREAEVCERQRMRKDGTLKKFKDLLRLEHRV